MCGYFYSYNIPIDIESLDSIRRRGPETFNHLTVKNEQFGHALLNTRGKSTPQPIQNSQGTLVYNGSTYNSDICDTQWIVDNLDEKLETTVDLIKNLIGEYSLTYVTDSHIVFAADQWSTKNLYFYYDQSTKTFLIASAVDFMLHHVPNAVRAQGNRIYIIDKNTFELDIIETTQWNFSQTINNYDRVFETFEQAVKDRHELGITTYMLSAGIDAGVIVCCAKKFFNDDMHTVSKVGREDPEILSKRMAFQKNPRRDRADDSAFMSTTNEMFRRYNFENVRGPNPRALTAILQNHFLPLKQKICMSGIGGDELYDDYQTDKKAHGRVGKIIGGWPSDLRTIYPWHNYEQTRLNRQLQRSDIVCGYHGIEGRYPLTDQRLFQQFLNTTSNLKNSGYKHWQVQYMNDHDYPVTLAKTRFAS
jgi:asparagine synthetase B (glutamine-hydrolysing)|tara:strand:+ start:216 stop:1472 length:1257 start_codon:yes stop_codon:yes gene_type:complete